MGRRRRKKRRRSRRSSAERRGQEEERSSRGVGPIMFLLQLLLLVPLKLSRRRGWGGGGNPNFKWGLVLLPHPPIAAQITPPLLQPRGRPDIDLDPRLAARLALAPPPVQVQLQSSPLVPIGHAEKLYSSSSSSCGPPGPLWLLPFCCYCRSCHTSTSCSCLLSLKENNMRCFNATIISSM